MTSGPLEDYILQPRQLQDQPWSRSELKNADANPISHFLMGLDTQSGSQLNKRAGGKPGAEQEQESAQERGTWKMEKGLVKGRYHDATFPGFRATGE
ncbi:hypothetical protein HYFRA_00010949 [Hymenoscyphus fraxineus]|uniref:Uncharacterized protein n=1 Tax=Hymenoscyphus fraxineus TaxID=746836 RepID=A0A9N9KZQ0_9HELO|nr:hypothetical protein HYFRA_00010949 [Hymenoscyphus fraxineus]